MISLPSLIPYTDKYFLRSIAILQKENLNPFVRAQVFIRKGPGYVFGIKEATSLIHSINARQKEKVTVFSLTDGDYYTAEETIMHIEGRAQDILLLETVILGILSAETTKANDDFTPNPDEIKDTVRKIVTSIAGRPVVYFGARHWRYDMDREISSAALAGGASDASTDSGAGAVGKKGVGTIPHALQCIFAWKYGMKFAVLESIKAFDRHMDKNIPRVALIDFANKEIYDSLHVARVLGNTLSGIRVDTCGENVMQDLPVFADHKNEPYWHGTGVTVAGVYQLRKELQAGGFPGLKIMLSSGFGDLRKVTAFVTAEQELNTRLFDSLGIGQVFPVRAATMDIISVGETRETMKPISKVGRYEKRNPRLRKIPV